MLRIDERAYGVAAVVAMLAAAFAALNINRVEFEQSGAVAMVNGAPVSEAEYARALDAMQSGLERALTEDDKKKALSLLIDEELLVQQALKLDLAQEDRLVRKNLVQVMMNSVTLRSSMEDPDEQALRTLYDEERNLFAEPRMVSVEAARSVAGESDFSLFSEALEQNASFADAVSMGRYETVEIPDAIPASKVSQYLGGTISAVVVQMRDGDIAGPIESDGREYVLWLKRSSGGAQSFEAAEPLVVAEWRRRAEEEALEKYLKKLRKSASIQRQEIPEQADE